MKFRNKKKFRYGIPAYTGPFRALPEITHMVCSTCTLYTNSYYRETITDSVWNRQGLDGSGCSRLRNRRYLCVHLDDICQLSLSRFLREKILCNSNWIVGIPLLERFYFHIKYIASVTILSITLKLKHTLDHLNTRELLFKKSASSSSNQ
jgi:hypothetical protein